MTLWLYVKIIKGFKSAITKGLLVQCSTLTLTLTLTLTVGMWTFGIANLHNCEPLLMKDDRCVFTGTLWSVDVRLMR